MRYAILIYDTETATPSPEPPPAEVMQQVMDEYFAYSKMLRDRGVYHGGEALHPVQTATTLRGSESGDVTATDGPFAETKEALGGYGIFEADDLDAAIELAARIPAARMGGAIEVRPIVER